MLKILRSFPALLAVTAGSLVAAIVYLFFALIMENLALNLIATAVTLGGVSYRLLLSFARRCHIPRPQRWAAVVSVLSVAGIATVVGLTTLAERCLSKPYPVDNSTVKLLAQNTIPLTTVQPGSGFDDLQALKPILEGRRIVALGEATHGTSEFFKMKHRLLEFLVREMGYEHFGMETSAEVAQVVNDYITGGSGRPQAVLYWPWATQEVMDMLDWMRAYNADPSTTHPLVFHGIDPTVGNRDGIMAQNVAQILEQNGPQSKIVLWAHNAHIANAEGRLGSYLKQQFDEQVYLLGFEFNQGEFTSRMATVHTYGVKPAPPTYYAYALAKANHPILFLDFRTMACIPELRAWLATDQSSHELQELYAVYRLYPAWHTLQTSWLGLYDGVIFVDKSTPTSGLP